jgi:hypothetical protein
MTAMLAEAAPPQQIRLFRQGAYRCPDQIDWLDIQSSCDGNEFQHVRLTFRLLISVDERLWLAKAVGQLALSDSGRYARSRQLRERVACIV